MIEEKFTKSQSYFLELKKKNQTLQEGAADAREAVKTIVEQLESVKYPMALPKEAVFENLGELIHVYQVPKVSGMDDRGKAKKPLSADEMSHLQTLLASGAMDGKDWSFNDKCPSKKQVEKLTEFIAQRNEVIDAQRVDEENARSRALATYKEELGRWDKDEKTRKMKHDKVKKESRKANLRLQGFEERIERISKEFQSLESDMNTMKDIREMNSQCLTRFKVMRVKLQLESERRQHLIKDIKMRLLKSLDARKRAIEAPNGAVTTVAFSQLTARSEESLRLLRVDIFTLKQNLVSEGTRLRLFWSEEACVYQAELTRIRTLREVVNHRICMDNVLARNRYEIMNLFEDLDKLRLMEASRDDRGVVGTVDNLGERYSSSKVKFIWDIQHRLPTVLCRRSGNLRV
jgi:archaellum component FlaC